MPKTRDAVQVAVKKENNNIFLIFFFLKILKQKYIVILVKDKNIRSLLL
jgi:hypothetical protein